MNSTLITKIKGLTITVLLLGSQVANGQSIPTKTENHMLKREARTATQTKQDFEGLFDRSDVVETVEYFDGLGRPAQTVQWEASPDGHDIITTHSYNALGQKDRQYLPYSSRHNLGKCQDASKVSHERTSFFSVANTELAHWPAADLATPFGETVFEASPLGRVVEQSAPGQAWQVERDAFGNSTGQGHTLRSSWRPNLLSDSIIFFPNGAGVGFQVTKYWPAGELWATISQDENGNVKQQFSDKQGRLIAEKTQIDNQTSAYTYYIYAANSHDLAIVIQPQGARQLVISPNNGLLSQNLLDKQAFQYRYDARHRMIEKRVPGSDWTYIIYNNINQPILTQDGNQAANDEWVFTKYDAIGRPILTGIWTDNLGRSRAVIQQLIQQETMLWEKSSNQHVSFLKGYTNNAFPDITANCELLAVSYFDSYDFNRNGQTDPNEGFVNDPRIGGINELSMLSKGKTTAVNQRIIGTNDWLLTVTFYDALGRELQTVSENSLGGEDRITFSYNFNGTVARSCHRHTTSVETIEVYKEFTYDHRDRLIEIAQDLHKGGGNWTPQPIILAKNEYNELGELVSKGLHSQNQGMSFLQNVDFKYNIRGWLSKINEIETCGKVGGTGISEGSHSVDVINLDKFTASVSSTGTGELKIAYADQKTVDLTSNQNGASLTAKGDLHRETFLAASLPSTNTVQLNVPMNNLKVLKDNYQIAESTLRQAASSQLRTSGLSASDQAEVVNTLAAGMVGELDDIFKPNEDLFAMELKYTQQIGLNSAASSQYNGNIAAMKWQTPGSCEAKTYAFQYDKQNRLLNAWFAMENINGWINQDRYSTSYDYDLNGNLRQLNREGMIGANQFGRMDEMTYSYDGNQLLSIADAGPDNLPTGVTHFIDNIMDQAIEYQYDANGNMIEDENKGLTASYNLFNKPTEVDMGNGRKIRFFYLADGTKIRKEVVDNGTSTTTHYLGGFQYEDAGNGPELVHFSHEEGRVVFNASGPQFFDLQYRLTDHLGNTRILFREDPFDPGETEVLQEQAYYPFGMTLAEGNLPVSSPADHYTYNGKEIQTEFGLGWMDYGARMYDPSVGHWNGVDPLAVSYARWSSYHFSGNNPIKNIDLNGMSYTDYYNKATGELIETIDDGSDAKVKVDETFYFDQKCNFQEAGGNILNEEGAQDFSTQLADEATGYESENGTDVFSESTGDAELTFDGDNLRMFESFDDGSSLKVGEWSAISGPHGNGALPNGDYDANNLRTRDEVPMVRNGVGFSMDLSDKWDPNINQDRVELRIHPDGNVSGTEGCIGLTCNASGLQGFYNTMQSYLSNHDKIKVVVNQ